MSRGHRGWSAGLVARKAGSSRDRKEGNTRRRTRPCGTTTVERARRHGNRRSMVQPGAWAGGRSRQLPRIMESHKKLHAAYTRGRSREDNGRQPEAPRTFGMPGRQIRATGSKSHKHRPSIVPILLVLEKGSLCFQRSSAATWLPCANAQHGALRSCWALVYKGDQKALERFLVCRRTCRDQESSPANRPCAMPYCAVRDLSAPARPRPTSASQRMPEDMDEVYDGLSTQSAEELRMTPWPGRARWSRPGRTSQP